ncbi:Basic 7S globulin [Apostasia shenzhenica]|uniref:Basic 7S globulin n=1 Tax=Apostasia shenzhenica TaxID=1088818 RepID=A0A2I0B390_9ASPA|nr:Basic 7S globulin [Apostasia shenzhenica]
MSFSSKPLILRLASFLLLLSIASAAHRPAALVAPVTKDPSTLQYITRLHQRTPLVSVDLAIDLGGRHLWVDCDSGYTSSTYRPTPCRSALCSLAGANSCSRCFSSSRPGCNNNTCGVFPENPFTSTSTSGELAEDVLALSSTDGSNPGALASDPSFLFSCAPAFLTKGLAAGASGIAGLGRTRVAPPSQLAAHFSFRRRFALCLPSTSRGTGVLFFGNSRYRLLPDIDASQILIYTPLLTNPVSTAGTSVSGEPSAEYFIGVKGIRVGEKAIALNKTLLEINRKTGIGGTKISTAVPYTALETSIYNALTAEFALALSHVKRVPAVAPFRLCFEEKGISPTRVGPSVPAIDLVLQRDDVYWRIFGANSMVEAKTGVLCLGFVDAGKSPRTAIVVGGLQLEDNLVTFDLAYSRVGFSSTLFFRRTTCSNFNFTSTA